MKKAQYANDIFTTEPDDDEQRMVYGWASVVTEKGERPLQYVRV